MYHNCIMWCPGKAAVDRVYEKLTSHLFVANCVYHFSLHCWIVDGLWEPMKGKFYLFFSFRINMNFIFSLGECLWEKLCYSWCRKKISCKITRTKDSSEDFPIRWSCITSICWYALFISPIFFNLFIIFGYIQVQQNTLIYCPIKIIYGNMFWFCSTLIGIKGLIRSNGFEVLFYIAFYIASPYDHLFTSFLLIAYFLLPVFVANV